MQQTILNLLTTCMTELKATTAGLKVPAALSGDSPFGVLLSQAMDEGSLQGAAGGVAQVKSSAPLDLPALLLAFLGENVETSGQAAQATAGLALLQTASDKGLKASVKPAAGSTQDEGTIAGTHLKSGQQLQDLIMGLLALVMTNETGAGSQTAAATGSDSGEEKAAAAQDNGITTGVKSGDDDGPSHRGKASSNSGASNSASETDNRHLLDTLALLLFTGLETIRGEPGKESGTSGETQSLLPKDGGAEKGVAAAQPAAGGQTVESAHTEGRETVASPGDEPKGFAARFLDAVTEAVTSTGTAAVTSTVTSAVTSSGTEAPTSTGTAAVTSAVTEAPTSTGTAAVRAELTLMPAGGTGAGENGLTLQISVGNARAFGQTSLGGETARGGTTGVKGALGPSSDGAVTVVKELAPLLFEGRDGSASHDPAAGKESPGAKEVYPIVLNEHISINDEPTQEQQVSGQQASAGTIERFDRVMEQVGGGTGLHDMTVRLTIGSDESLVLGLKDLGQTVTVEVKGSNQGMINLLQSQRDVIISHLEGKDISANIIIDPNASGTSEKRERREMRQRTSAARAKVGGGFDGLLEIFA